MKKKVWIPIVLVLVVAAVLFTPVYKGSYDDGGTREYNALTYKIVAWNRISENGVYEKTRIYLGADRNKPIEALWLMESDNAEYTFTAKIAELYGKSVIVEPLDSEPIAKQYNRISFGIANLPQLNVNAGDYVTVTYKGYAMESYPAQIKATHWEQAHDLRGIAYTEQWLDCESAEKYESKLFSDIIITDIYSNCFFAYPAIPMPYTIKINGILGDDWCVGDQITCDYENTYYDQKNHRVEADLVSADSVKIGEWEPKPGMAYKPVIYLYPENPTEVTVTLTPNGDFTCTYPAYDGAWCVNAQPDGTLTDKNGQTYNYLYWEGNVYADYDTSHGFCVKGADTAAFLESALAALGLNRREANEFIVFWLPLMQDNPYNVISFQTDRYTDAAPLEIIPTPDTVIRVFMTYYPSDTPVYITEQELSSVVREGFTVVEWGGTELK